MKLLEDALDWAAAGVPVFPTGEDKRPLTKNGHKDASTDPDTITRMFEQAGSRLHGIGGRMGAEAGLFAIDADTYKPGEAGEISLAYLTRLSDRDLLLDTRVHATRNGGEHYFFRSPNGVYPNVNPVSGVEVKGEGGYVILPPSPGYTIKHDLRAAVAPVALIDELQAARQQQASRGIDELKKLVLNGSDFHDPLVSIAAKRAADGWSIDQVQAELLTTLTASVALSPTHPRHDRWRPLVENTQGELTRIVESANAKFNPTIATDALREAAQAAGATFADTAPPPWTEEASAPPTAKSVGNYQGKEFPLSYRRGWFAQEDLKIKEQRFVMYPILSEGEVTLISADPKAGKTLVSQTIAMHIACGEDLAGLKVAEKRPVIYFALESQMAIRRRLEAWCQYKGGSQKKDMALYAVEGGINLLDEAARVQLANDLADTETWFQQEQGAQPLGAIVIDTLTKAMPGGDQNSVEDTSAVFDTISRIRAAGIRAPVVIIHHNTKNGGGPRGSGNIQAEPDTLLTVNKDEENGQLELKVLMARSIDDTQSFRFNIETEDLDKTVQGYPLSAPVLVPATEDGDTIDVDYINEMMKYMPVYEFVAQNVPSGKTLDNKALHRILKACAQSGAALEDEYAPFTHNTRADTATLNALWAKMFPSSMQDIDLKYGCYNFTSTWKMNKDQKPLLTGLTVRKYENHNPITKGDSDE